jgi:hypothetical protein
MNKDKRIATWLAICVLVIVLSLLFGRRPRTWTTRTAPAVVTTSAWKESTSDEWRKERPVALSFDVLKKWTYVAGKTPIPDFIRVFDGKNVEMTGYMMPLNTVKDIKSFILVPSLFGCCYGQPPAVNHIVLVNMADGKTSQYFEDAVRVRGQFHCGEEKQDGELLSLYRIDADEVVAK